MTAATKRKRITKKAFETVIESRYPNGVEARVHTEDHPDGSSNRMTLYYEVLDELDKHGLQTRHCATWMEGEGWEFLAAGEKSIDDVLHAIAAQESFDAVQARQKAEQEDDEWNREGALCSSILCGDYDNHLSRLSDAINERKKSIRTAAATEMKASLSVGDKVVIPNISPKYLEGAVAIVTELPSRGKKVVIRLAESRRKWEEGTEARVPATCLEPTDLPMPPGYSGIKVDKNLATFWIRLETEGNPDFQQYAPITDPIELGANTWADLCKQIEEWKSYWQVGGGNWTGPILYKSGEKFGQVSYNLRVWELDGTTRGWPLEAKEIPQDKVAEIDTVVAAAKRNGDSVGVGDFDLI